ncbi:MAG: 5'-methylthioadenosine/S-adenosylhomocysteine nucleosidase [Bdellovibrionales bacterium]|nr:5'-methylthioadenosine/S-adenosylhomocysteine nucleosidase [Bdellovibrionales bacterium]
MKKIGIISALPQELEEIQSQINNIKPTSYKITTGLSGIGKVNAAMTAQKFISEKKCELLVFSGVAGGLHHDYQIGDIVMPKKAFQHDYGWMGSTFQAYAPNTLPIVGIGTGKESIFTDLTLHWEKDTFKGIEQHAQAFAKEQFESVPLLSGTRKPKLYINATLATGDQFLSNDLQKKRIFEMGADLVEMEGAAVALVAHANQVPCLLFRAISDTAGKESIKDFPAFVSTVSKNNASLLMSLLQNKLL